MKVDEQSRTLAGVHLRCGWTALLVFLTVGVILEALHGFKVASYLDVGQESRRLMWTLGHAHGTLLGLVNLGFAASAERLSGMRGAALASWTLMGATVLLPSGFLLGGTFLSGEDPGLGVLLVPVGAVCLLVAVGTTTAAVWRATR